MLAAGLCGTDLALRGRQLPTRIPRTLGHEFVGRVLEVEAGEHAGWIGQRVCADINFGCPARPPGSYCSECKSTDRHHCLKRDVLGIDNAEGAFAEEVIVPVVNLLPVPAHVSDVAAVFTEPLAAALHAFAEVPLRAEDVVVVLGAGRLGALIARVATLAGATVLAVSRSERPPWRAASIWRRPVGGAAARRAGRSG